MANISNIPVFIIRGAFAVANSSTTPVSFSQLLGKQLDVSNYPDAAFKYNFSDGNGDKLCLIPTQQRATPVAPQTTGSVMQMAQAIL